MPDLTPVERKLRAKIAYSKRYGRDDEAAEARRDLRASRLEAQIRTVVDTWPPLTDEQLTRLAGLLRPVARDGAAAA